MVEGYNWINIISLIVSMRYSATFREQKIKLRINSFKLKLS